MISATADEILMIEPTRASFRSRSKAVTIARTEEKLPLKMIESISSRVIVGRLFEGAERSGGSCIDPDIDATHLSTACAPSAPTSALFPMFHGIAEARIEVAKFARCFSLRPGTTTAAPSSTKRHPMAWPMYSFATGT